MAYRPYPNVDRALRQLDRHCPPAPVIPMSPALQSVGEGCRRIQAGLRHAAEQGFGAGTYVLSTRRPDAGRLDVGDGASAITARPWTQAEREAWHRGEGSPRPGVVGGPA